MTSLTSYIKLRHCPFDFFLALPYSIYYYLSQDINLTLHERYGYMYSCHKQTDLDMFGNVGRLIESKKINLRHTVSSIIKRGRQVTGIILGFMSIEKNS